MLVKLFLFTVIILNITTSDAKLSDNILGKLSSKVNDYVEKYEPVVNKYVEKYEPIVKEYVEKYESVVKEYIAKSHKVNTIPGGEKIIPTKVENIEAVVTKPALVERIYDYAFKNTTIAAEIFTKYDQVRYIIFAIILLLIINLIVNILNFFKKN